MSRPRPQSPPTNQPRLLDEWKRYLNMTPDQLQKLFIPLDGQSAEEVKNYGLDVLRQLREPLVYTDIADFIASLETRILAAPAGYETTIPK
jgi:hypothetical protein